MSKRSNILFITWDGPQVNYLEALFLPLFAALREKGFHFHVIQFTWGEAARTEITRQACAQYGIPCRFIKVWRQPRALGAAFTLAAGSRHIAAAIREWQINILLPRSTLPAVSALLARRGAVRLPLLLDADGLPHDERVDFSGWSRHGLAYRLLKKLEAYTVVQADVVLTRSAAATSLLRVQAGIACDPGKFHVVLNGRDPVLYQPLAEEEATRVRASLGLGATQPLLVYAGSLGAKYCPEAIMHLFSLVREACPDAALLILTGQVDAAARLQAAYPALAGHMRIMRLTAGQVPRFLAAADVGLALIQPAFSMRAAAAIKVGEYLLCGVPVVATKGGGEIPSWLNSQTAIVLEDCAPSHLLRAARWIVDEVMPARARYRENCRALGEARFTLSSSVHAYEQALRDARAGEAG